MNKPYHITCDLFTIPLEDGKSILYAPKAGFLCKANHHVVNLLSAIDKIDSGSLNEKQIQVLDKLEEHGILNGSREAVVQKSIAGRIHTHTGNPVHYKPVQSEMHLLLCISR